MFVSYPLWNQKSSPVDELALWSETIFHPAIDHNVDNLMKTLWHKREDMVGGGEATATSENDKPSIDFEEVKLID